MKNVYPVIFTPLTDKKDMILHVMCDIIVIEQNRNKKNSGKIEKAECMEVMNMQENARLVLGLRAAAWSEKKINDFILYIATGEEQYKPEPDKAE